MPPPRLTTPPHDTNAVLMPTASTSLINPTAYGAVPMWEFRFLVMAAPMLTHDAARPHDLPPRRHPAVLGTFTVVLLDTIIDAPHGRPTAIIVTICRCPRPIGGPTRWRAATCDPHPSPASTNDRYAVVLTLTPILRPFSAN